MTKLPWTLCLADVENNAHAVWVNPCVDEIRLNQLPVIRVESMEQLLEIYNKLNDMRRKAEAEAKRKDERISELLHEIDRQRAIIADLRGEP